jgi:endonuclease G, mitochondrial
MRRAPKTPKRSLIMSTQRIISLNVGEALRLRPDHLFISDDRLDFSLIALEESAEGPPGDTYGWFRLDRAVGKIAQGERVVIVSHPQGAPKTVTITDDGVVNLLEDYLHYESRGFLSISSGSPVLNMQWELVAMHHASILSGGIASTVRHEGIRISAVLNRLESARRADDAASPALTELLVGVGSE